MIFVTGGAGFIDSDVVLDWLKEADDPVVNVDKLIHAGKVCILSTLRKDMRRLFIHRDICDTAPVAALPAERVR